MTITVLGAGEIGVAIRAALSPAHTVSMWDIEPGKVEAQKELEEIIPPSQIIFLCIPSRAINGALADIGKYMNSKSCVVSLAKGMEAKSGKFVYEILEAALGPDRYALLSGPMLAEELAEGKGAAAVVASRGQAIDQNLFKPHTLRLEYSPDIHSVAVAGVLKNVYTLILGIADGLGYGNNVKGFLVSKILAEAPEMASALKADIKILLGTPGLADFIATAFSPLSLNREAGFKIAQGGQAPESEGLLSLPHLIGLLGRADEYPVLSGLQKIIMGKQNPKTVVQQIIYG